MDAYGTSQMCRAFCNVAAQFVTLPECAGCSTSNCAIIHHLPMSTWLPIGDDAILTGYSDAMAALTDGGIVRSLGTSCRDYFASLYPIVEACARTHESDVYEVVYCFASAGGTWRFLACALHLENGTVGVVLVPIGRLGEVEPMRGRKGVRKKGQGCPDATRLAG